MTEATKKPMPSGGHMLLFLDIETIPVGDPIDPNSLTPPASLKKPETIFKWYEEEAPAIAEEQYRKRALDSMAGEMIVISHAIDDEDPTCLSAELMSEPEMLHSFEATVRKAANEYRPITFVGWGNKTFDVVWLWRKAIQYGLVNLRRIFNRDRYRGNVLDLMEVWGADYKDFRKMNDVAKFLGIQGKPDDIDGSKVYDYFLAGEWEKIKTYCMGDVSTVREIYKRIME